MGRLIRQTEIETMAGTLVAQLADFDPQAVVYIHSAGQFFGEAIARSYSTDLFKLDLRYPFSRVLTAIPKPLLIPLWPLKELMYKISNPSFKGTAQLPNPGVRVILVDDSASSGRTIRTALRILKDNGHKRKDIRVAVLRCGARARELVDHYVTGNPRVFSPPKKEGRQEA